MDSQTIENVIDTILKPDFRCTLGRDNYKNSNPTYAFIEFCKMGITYRANGGLQDGMLYIGENLSQLNLEKASIIIFDEQKRILYNDTYTVHQVREQKKQIQQKITCITILFSCYKR